MSKPHWHGRGFTSLLTLASFLIMTLSGIIAYLMPAGRIAYWVHWSLWGMSKEQWGALHTLSSLFFILAGGVHLYYNWTPLVRYLTGKFAGTLRLRRELALTLAICLLVFFSSLWRLPPLSYVLDFGDYLKDSWVTEKDFEPPFGHAEQVSLRVFARRTNIELEPALAALHATGVQFDDDMQTLDDIARNNRMSPLQIYRLIKPFERPPEIPEQKKVYTPELVEEEFAGTGVGQKTLAEIAFLTGWDETAAMRRLAEKGVRASGDETFKKIADRAGVSALDILKALLVDEDQPNR